MKYWESPNGLIKLHCGNCLELMPTMEASSVDSIVTDPPYGIRFMGKEWDHGVPGVPFWTEALRVAKPGAHLLAFGGTRTHHRLMCAIEDAGWEIRDCLGWLYGSGFPKSLDVSKAIDKAAGAEREVVGVGQYAGRGRTAGIKTNALGSYSSSKTDVITAPTTPAALQWQGWGTALKPAWEPIVLARKSLDGTVAANVQKWGTGAINVDGCRVDVDPTVDDMLREVFRKPRKSQTWEQGSGFKNESNPRTGVPSKGRFPANILHDGSDEVLAVFPSPHGAGSKRGAGEVNHGEHSSIFGIDGHESNGMRFGDSGSAARFFYCAKASKSERGEGNNHPTVKPLALTRYLCRLITPPAGTVLDMFMGSGSTGIAAAKEGFRFIGCENIVENFEIAVKRIEAHIRQGRLF